MLIAIFSSVLFQSSCSKDKLPTKSELIAAYNEFAKISPPTLGEGDYPLTANFSREDKGKEHLANALVEIGFIQQQSSSSSDLTRNGNVKKYYLTKLGKENYDKNTRGFVWGHHSATDIIKVAGPFKINNSKLLYVSIRTKIVNIPEWAYKPVILDNYPIVKSALNNNQFIFNATFKYIGDTWTLVEVND